PGAGRPRTSAQAPELALELVRAVEVAGARESVARGLVELGPAAAQLGLGLRRAVETAFVQRLEEPVAGHVELRHAEEVARERAQAVRERHPAGEEPGVGRARAEPVGREPRVERRLAGEAA